MRSAFKFAVCFESIFHTIKLHSPFIFPACMDVSGAMCLYLQPKGVTKKKRKMLKDINALTMWYSVNIYGKFLVLGNDLN